MGEYYRKEGRKYVKCYDMPRLYADGIWLVSQGINSAKRILKIGELSELFPYAQMAQDLDEFSNFLVYKTRKWFEDTLKVWDDGTVQYCNPPAADMAQEILKFLAMSEKERKEEIEKCVVEDSHLDHEGFIRDGRGKILHKWFSKEALTKQKNELEEKLESVNKFLKQCEK